jgi:hypothetical protein
LDILKLIKKKETKKYKIKIFVTKNFLIGTFKKKNIKILIAKKNIIKTLICSHILTYGEFNKGKFLLLLSFRILIPNKKTAKLENNSKNNTLFFIKITS